jgi:hypothetical protein
VVAWPIGGCRSPGGGVADPPTLTDINFVQALVYLENSLLLLLLAVVTRGGVPLRRTVTAVLRAAIGCLLALQAKGFGLVPLLRRFGLVLIGTGALAVAADEIQLYLHGIAQACDASMARPCLTEAFQPDLVVHEAAAIASLLLAVLGFALAPALLIYRWRVASNTLRFAGLVGLALLPLVGILALSLFLFNLLFLQMGITTREPFTLGPGAYLSLLLVVSVLVVAFLRRRGSGSRR